MSIYNEYVPRKRNPFKTVMVEYFEECRRCGKAQECAEYELLRQLVAIIWGLQKAIPLLM
jgi:hypothetical protein